MPPASPDGGAPVDLPLIVPCPRCGGRIVVVGHAIDDTLRLTAGGTCTDCGGTVYSALDMESARR